MNNVAVVNRTLHGTSNSFILLHTHAYCFVYSVLKTLTKYNL